MKQTINKITDNTLDSFKYVMKRSVIVPVALAVAGVTVGVGIYKWWKRKIS